MEEEEENNNWSASFYSNIQHFIKLEWIMSRHLILVTIALYCITMCIKFNPHGNSHPIPEIIKDYCGTLNVKAIRANLFLVHELLEENLDFGIFQCLNTSDLRTLG